MSCFINKNLQYLVNKRALTLDAVSAKTGIAADLLEKFISDVSTWFIRRSRDRVWVNSDDVNDKKFFYNTL